MDSTLASFLAGAIVALISGSLALVATNYKEFQRRWNAHRIKTTVNKALDVLENATVTNEKTQAISDITQKSKEKDYSSCFDWPDRKDQARILGEKGGDRRGR